MKENKLVLWSQKNTDPLLLKAHLILSSYSKATRAQTCIMDHNFLSIPESFDGSMNDRNTCLFCIKCHYNFQINKNEDFIFHPCRDLHIDMMKKAFNTGRSCRYMCDLGFMFWTSPVFRGSQFIGSFIGSGFLNSDRKDTAQKMEALCKGTEKREEIDKRVSLFPAAGSNEIQALAELMQACAESVAGGNSSYYKTLKRRSEQQKDLMGIIDELKKKFPEALPQYPAEKEKAFLEAINNGDAVRGLPLLNDILGSLFFIYQDQFRNVKYRTLELAILLSRMDNFTGDTSAGYSHTVYQFIKSIEEAQNPEELIDAIHLMTRHLAEEAFSFRGIRHVSALKKADRYIQNNFTRKISLDEIAEASGLSAPYFSSIFKEEMGENLSSYLNRLRVEKAAHLLSETDFTLSKIAASCGFEDQSWFSKIFQNYTGINPGKYRQEKRNPALEIPENSHSEGYRAQLDSA